MSDKIVQRFPAASSDIGSLPWHWSLEARTAALRLPRGFHALSWAPLGGGYVKPRLILNHQVDPNDFAATTAPAEYLRKVARSLGNGNSHGRSGGMLNATVANVATVATVAMMTAADVSATTHALLTYDQLAVAVWCTAGCSNALRVGDSATFETAPGTINLVVLISAPLSQEALAEAIQIATEAHVVSVMNARVTSRRSGKPATGTGTDCIVVASPMRRRAHHYCGKHTMIGEMIGRATLQACSQALKQKPVNTRQDVRAQ